MGARVQSRWAQCVHSARCLPIYLEYYVLHLVVFCAVHATYVLQVETRLACISVRLKVAVCVVLQVCDGDDLRQLAIDFCAENSLDADKVAGMSFFALILLDSLSHSLSLARVCDKHV